MDIVTQTQIALEGHSIKKIARGAKQQSALEHLLAGDAVTPFHVGLSGNAKNYWGSYKKSWDGFVQRLHAAGFELEVIPGPRGGTSQADWRLKQ